MEKRNSLRTALGYLSRLMRGEQLTVRGILESDGGSDSTIRRHLGLLKELVPEVERSPGRPATWSFRWPEEPAADAFTMLVLRLARRTLSFLRDSELDLKLEELIAEKQARSAGPGFADVSRMFYAKTHAIDPLVLSPDIIDKVVLAISKCRRAEAVYESFEGLARKITLDPYTLVFADSGLYCFGRCEDSVEPRHIDERRVYNLARFRRFRLTADQFVYPERDAYDPETLFGNCFGIIVPGDLTADPEDVVLRFRPRWRHYLNTHKWHHSQSTPKPTSDGWFEVSFRLHITFDLVRWIRGLGKEVEVAKPKHLDEEVKELVPYRHS